MSGSGADIPENAWVGAERGAVGRGADSGCHENSLERWAANRTPFKAVVQSA